MIKEATHIARHSNGFSNPAFLFNNYVWRFGTGLPGDEVVRWRFMGHLYNLKEMGYEVVK